MPVAKSYQGLKELSEPYRLNGRMYIKVETKKGEPKQVRWYSNSEYEKMYKDSEPVIKTKDNDPYFKTQKYVLGFDKGYITIFRNTREEHEEWFKHSICRFAKHWGWYVVSTEEIPKDLPLGVEPVKLYWDPMGDDKERLKDSGTVRAHVMQTLYPRKETSEKQGDIGDRIERILTVKEVTTIENPRFNSKTNIHIMRDAKNNLYMWKTSAKLWAEGSSRLVRGTIKEYDEYKGEDITVLTRCIEQ